ncbi:MULTISPECIES: hypothetical protein [unclassified Nonomuraea]|uniref:hypothetical protein n=1 Tax=unclassified Nonomuraea TaxID=2593643 RepID=UPI0035BFFB01
MRAVLEKGRLVSLGVEPRLLREPADVVAGLVAEAVDAAFGRASSAADDGVVPFVEPLALARELRAVRAELDARMARVTASIEVSAAALRAGARAGAGAVGGVPGGVPSLAFGELFDQLIDMLETIGGVPDADLRGVSEGPVSAVCAPGPRLVSLSVAPWALYGGTRALGERVVRSVNAALDDLEAGVLRRRAESGAGADRVMARVAELREEGVLRMRAYTQGMAGLMAGIRPRA